MQLVSLLLCAATLQGQFLAIPSKTIQEVGGVPRFISETRGWLLTDDGKIALAPTQEMRTHSNAVIPWKLGEDTFREVELVQISKPGILVLATKNQYMYLDQQGGSELLKPEPRGGFAQADTQVLDAESLDSVTITHAAWGGNLDSMYERRGGISRISLTDQDTSASHLIYEPKIGAVTHAVASRDGSEFLTRVTIQVHTKQMEEHIWRVVSLKGMARDVSMPEGWLPAAFDNSKLNAILLNESGRLARYDFKRKRLTLLPPLASADLQLQHIALGSTLLVSMSTGTFELTIGDTWRKVGEARLLASSRDGGVLLLSRGATSATLVRRTH